ncbi:MAG: sulfurtransferase TusA family protein [Peptococcia bacterium]|jgi:tRNA 2-thiouridine synthesizing protein A
MQIDARGLSCPQPVINTQKALKENPDGVEVLVDNVTARTNIERFARLNGYQVESQTENDSFLVKIWR